jgi:hypothetical protein
LEYHMKRLMTAALLLFVLAVPALADDPQPPAGGGSGEIEWTWNDGGITASDSWMRRQAAMIILTGLDILP